jgi:hypothetical protein
MFGEEIDVELLIDWDTVEENAYEYAEELAQAWLDGDEWIPEILLMMASVYADENKKWLNIGFQKRFEMFKKILGMQGIKVDSDVEVIYNVAMPVASTEMIANLKTLQEMGAISKETIMEKTEYVSDVEVEKKRLSGENVSQDVSQKVDNPSKKVEIK